MTKRGYAVELQTVTLDAIDDSLPDRLASALSADRHLAGPVVRTNSLTRVVGVRVSIDAVSIEEAFNVGSARIHRALRRSGIGANVSFADGAVMLELPEDEFAASRDDIVGTPDVAARLGVSRQRVAQLIDQPGRFPHSIATIRGTRVWRWGDIADWIEAGARDLRRRRRPAGEPTTRKKRRRQAA